MTLELKGFASVFNVIDAHKHVTIPGALYWRRQEPAMMLEHEGDQVGAWTRAAETMHGLYVEGVVYDRSIMRAILNRELMGLSIGFAMETIRFMEYRNRRVIARARVQEVSLTKSPSNPHCLIESVRMRGDKQWKHFPRVRVSGSRMRLRSQSAARSTEESTDA